MAIRLNKVLTELNIGLQTAVDFLKNKKNLGEIKEEITLSTKITEEQYEALVKEFKGDMAVKNEAERIFTKKNKEKKPEKKVQKGEDLLEERPSFKPIGKIDLDALEGKSSKTVNKEEKKPAAQAPKEKKAAPSAEEVAKPVTPVAPKEEPKVEQPAPVAEAEPKVAPAAPKEEPKEEKKAEAVKKEEHVAKAAVQEATPKQQEAQPEVKSATAQTTLYTTGSAEKMSPKLNVLGKIDLDAINQSTRPKKKSKEEKRREREEKVAQMHGANGERKKRVRIGKERVDIEAESQQSNANKKKNKGNGGTPNNANNQQQGGGKRNRKNRNQPKPVEVSDEDVARQVKETLARLTNKTQNKKAAKYRREKREAVQERLNEEM